MVSSSLLPRRGMAWPGLEQSTLLQKRWVNDRVRCAFLEFVHSEPDYPDQAIVGRDEARLHRLSIHAIERQHLG